MQVLIIGAGEVGSEVARRLSSEYQDVVLVEESEAVIDELEANLDALVVQGNGTSTEVLQHAGLASADILIAVTQTDEINIVACMTAKRAGVAKTVARIRNVEFEDGSHILDLNELGVDIAVHPERLAARKIARHIMSPDLDDVEYFADHQALMFSFTARESLEILDRPIDQIRFPDSCIIASIVKPTGEVVIPTGRDVVENGDKIYVIGRPDSLHEMDRILKTDKNARRDVVIFGAGMIGYELAKLLEADEVNGVSVKIIEKSRTRCEQIAERLSRTLVIHGDATDASLLEEEAADADVSVALMGDEEVNLLATLIAQTHGVKRTISKILKPENHAIFSKAGVDYTVNPRLSMVGKIVSLARKGEIVSLSLLEHDKAEIVELNVSSGAPVIGHTLAQAGLPPGIIVGTVIRNGSVHIPTGKTEVLRGDRLVLFARKGMEKEIGRFFG